MSRGSMLAKLREDPHADRQHAVLVGELAASHKRELASELNLLALSKHQVMRTQEFQHRLVNAMQLIVSLLSIRSRTVASPEAAAQLTRAAKRVAALGRVHGKLHLLDGLDHVDLRQYLTGLCVDLSDLMVKSETETAISVEGHDMRIGSAIAIPIGFIVAELTINALNTPAAISPFCSPPWQANTRFRSSTGDLACPPD